MEGPVGGADGHGRRAEEERARRGRPRLHGPAQGPRGSEAGEEEQEVEQVQEPEDLPLRLDVAAEPGPGSEGRPDPVPSALTPRRPQECGVPGRSASRR